MHASGTTKLQLRVFDRFESNKFEHPKVEKIIDFDGGCDEKSTNYSFLCKVEFLKVKKGRDEVKQCLIVVTNFLVIFYDLEAIVFPKKTAQGMSPEPYE